MFSEKELLNNMTDLVVHFITKAIFLNIAYRQVFRNGIILIKDVIKNNI